jgi:hypothetical protein
MSYKKSKSDFNIKDNADDKTILRRLNDQSLLNKNMPDRTF